MKTILFSFFIAMLAVGGASAWYDTKYDTVVTTWPDGKPKEYYTRMCYEGSGLDFLPHGQYSSWYENGQLKNQGHYDWERKYGTWIKWYDDGCRMEEITYIYGLRDGRCIKWHADGTLRLIGHFAADLKHGLWAEKRQGEDVGNPWLLFLYVEFYYHGDLLVKLEGEQGRFLQDKNAHYNEELDLWVEWKRDNKSDHLKNYLWFDIGKKINGEKVGIWVRLDAQGNIIKIINY